MNRKRSNQEELYAKLQEPEVGRSGPKRHFKDVTYNRISDWSEAIPLFANLARVR